jgi:uncharacterized protein
MIGNADKAYPTPVPALGCGACNLCCVVLQIPLLHKPAHMRCEFTGVHGSCVRHAEKALVPELAACEQFECVWLSSQRDAGRLPRRLRPDLCHVVMTVDYVRERHLYAQVDKEHAAAWREPIVAEYLDGALARGWTVEVSIGETHFDYQGS